MAVAMKRNLVLAALLALMGCASPTVTSEPDEPAASPTDEASPPPTEQASVGDAITIHNFEDNAVAITVLRVIDPAPHAPFWKPPKGKHYVAVEIQIAPQDAAYSDSPGNGAALIDADGRQYTETIAELKGVQGFGGSAKVSPGDRRVGAIIFQVPDGTKLDLFQFTLDSGFADETAEWNL